MVTWRALFDRAAEHEATAADVRAALAARRDGEMGADAGEPAADAVGGDGEPANDAADAGGPDRRGDGDDARS